MIESVSGAGWIGAAGTAKIGGREDSGALGARMKREVFEEVRFATAF